MSRSLTSALLVSLGLHAGLIAALPAGQGWGFGGALPKPELHASIRLPGLDGSARAERTPPGRAVAAPARAGVDETAEETAAAAGFGLPVPEAPRPYDSTELTDRPAALDSLPPDLETALPAGQSGRAILVLEIDDKGKVASITPEDSEIDPVSLERLMTAFAEMRFLPGRIGKTPVRTRMRIEVTIEDWRSGFDSRHP